jgi:hypothetical protein
MELWVCNFIDLHWYLLYVDELFKVLTDHLEGGREYSHSIPTGKLEARIFFYLLLKGPLHKISKKPLDAA